MVAGVRRPREECLADPGTIGTLSIGDIPIGTAEKRPLHATQLWERWGTSVRRGLLPPLFDVQVLLITPRGLLLRGFQVDTSNRLLTAVDSRTNPASTAGTAQHDLDLVSG